MAQQTRKWNPGDAANAFVRVILSDAWTMLGGVNEDEWQKTLAWFRARCPEAARVVHHAQALARVPSPRRHTACLLLHALRNGYLRYGEGPC